jgi:hypothetical protein
MRVVEWLRLLNTPEPTATEALGEGRKAQFAQIRVVVRSFRSFEDAPRGSFSIG